MSVNISTAVRCEPSSLNALMDAPAALPRSFNALIAGPERPFRSRKKLMNAVPPLLDFNPASASVFSSAKVSSTDFPNRVLASEAYFRDP